VAPRSVVNVYPPADQITPVVTFFVNGTGEARVGAKRDRCEGTSRAEDLRVEYRRLGRITRVFDIEFRQAAEGDNAVNGSRVCGNHRSCCCGQTESRFLSCNHLFFCSYLLVFGFFVNSVFEGQSPKHPACQDARAAIIIMCNLLFMKYLTRIPRFHYQENFPV
jgi:hypothetical protein